MIREKIVTIADNSNSAEQERVLMEECAELVQAVNKCHRYGASGKHRENLTEEMADVTIMIAQIAHIYKVSDKEILDMMDRKLDRQLTRMNED